MPRPASVCLAGSGDRNPGRDPREAIKAFVVASSPSEALATELKALVRERLAAYEVPREIEFVDELPLTTSGKIRRNELRRREVPRRPEALPDVRASYQPFSA